MSASAAYVEAGYKANRHNAAALAREQHIGTRVTELQEEQLAIHQQATAAAAANKQVTIESLIAEAEGARANAMSEKGGAAAAVSSHFFGELMVERCLVSPGTLAVCIREVQKSLLQSSKRLIESKIPLPLTFKSFTIAL